ncbi:protein kinase superfamily protein, partial [Striga asiatica]
ESALTLCVHGINSIAEICRIRNYKLFSSSEEILSNNLHCLLIGMINVIEGYERRYARTGLHLDLHMDNLLLQSRYAPLVQNSIEYVVNLCGGSTRVRLAKSVVDVITSRVLAVPSSITSNLLFHGAMTKSQEFG